MDPRDVSDGDFDDESSADEEEELDEQRQQTSSKKRKKKSRRKEKKRNQQRRAPKTLFWQMATLCHGVWGGLVKRTNEEKWGTIYDRRVSLLALDPSSATHRGMEELEAGAIACYANAATIVHAPGDRGAIIGAAVYIDSALPVTNAERLLDAAIERGRKHLQQLGDGLELRTAWVQTAAAMPEAQLCDRVRGNVRVGLGWAEMATHRHQHFRGIPQEPVEQGGMWWPRISAAHEAGGARLCELWLPVLSTALEIVQHLPIGRGGSCTTVADLKATVGCLAFPSHRLKIAYTHKGRPFLQSTKPEEELAVRCIHRVSMLLAEGDEANGATAAACPNLLPARVRELVNQHGKTLCHVDPRDCGLLAKLLGAEAAQAAGIEVVKYRRHRPLPPDSPECDFFQTVVVIFFGCSEMEALSIIGIEASEHSAVLKAPLGQGGVMMAIYLLDFSKRYHGNPRSAAGLPPGAWAFRATPYATVHGATWAQRIERMPPQEAEQMLRALARLPGGKTLGSAARGNRKGDVDDLRGCSAGGEGGALLAHTAMAETAAVEMREQDGDYVSVNMDEHSKADTKLPIGTEVEVFFNMELLWEQATVIDHIPEIDQHNVVYYNYLFYYKSDGLKLSHHRGTIRLRMRRSVYAALQLSDTSRVTGSRTRGCM